MRPLDWAVVAAYLGGTLALGVWLARRGSRSLADFFVGGRAIPWWLAGASMAAATFNVDTPLYVPGWWRGGASRATGSGGASRSPTC